MGTYIIFLVIAAILNLAAFIWLVIAGFKRGVLWGLAIFFFSPLSAIIFAITNWFDAKKPFLAYLLTSVLVLVPIFMMPNPVDQEFMARLNEKVEAGEIKENEIVLYIMNPELLDELEEKNHGEDHDVVLDESGEPVLDTANAGSKDERVDIKPVTIDPDKSPKSKSQEDPGTIVEEEESSLYPRVGEVKPDPLVTKKKAVSKDSVRVSLSKISNYKGRYFVVTTKNGSQHKGILIKTTKTRIVLRRIIYGGTFTYKIRRNKIKRLEMLKKEYVDNGS